MKEKEKIEVLERIIHDTLWMAIRYADGRHTYAPGMIRDAVKKLKEIYPDFKLRPDTTIEPPTKEQLEDIAYLKGDYLYDLFKK